MPLDEYRRKRHFDTTAEPAGDTHAATHRDPEVPGHLSYVIQKHAATRMHWDFRIELDGVLLSWAVPKGPSFDPRDKRLAMHVEDHPLEYGRFEGTIPKGEYGGGTVMVWDRGTWEPDHGDPREHLAQGHLKFYLFGERLRGKWMLVRTKGYGGKDSWLLFKEHDEYERPREEFEATSEWMTSVTTGRTMEQIADGADAVWHSSASVEENMAALKGRFAQEDSDEDVPPASETPSVPADPSRVEGAVTAPLPDHVEVELASLVKSVPEGERWLHEIKFDGYRIVARKQGEKVRLISRNGKDWTDRFRQVADAVARELSVSSAMLDGEVVVMQPDGTTSFQALQNLTREGVPARLHYQVFDLLHLDGWDLRGAPLVERKRLLSSIIGTDDGSTVRYTDHIEGHGDVFFNQACDFSLEGVISKRRDSIYRPGRQREWTKTKCLNHQEFVIVGFTDPGGTRQAFGALVLAVHEDGQLTHVGRVGTGFSDASLREIHGRLMPLERDTPPVVNPPTGASGRGIHWVEPHLVAEVEFAEWTSERLLRHPSFLGLREDKPTEEVVAEQPVELRPAEENGEEADAAQPALAGAVASAKAKAGVGAGAEDMVASVRLTNPGRIFWPDTGTTKLETARYYESIEEFVLPHMVGRPLSLVRCPQGYTGECFYQKSIRNFPKSVKTVGVYVPEDDEVKPFGTIDDLAGLIGLVQMGVLEIHPWGSKNGDMERPDMLVFDLDPDTGMPFRQVAGTALLLRHELEWRGLQSWVKSTGGKGLHVVVPIEPGPSWDDAKTWAKRFVDQIVAMEPRAFTSNMSKAKRENKIFIDYLRNARGATAVGAYSTRARPGAPVAVPLSWDDLPEMTEKPDFTVMNAPDLLRERGSDPWEHVEGCRQPLPPHPDE